MSYKSQARTMARELRRTTGIDFVLANKIGRALARGQGRAWASAAYDRSLPEVKYIVEKNYCPCCGPGSSDYYQIVGPKGTYDL